MGQPPANWQGVVMREFYGEEVVIGTAPESYKCIGSARLGQVQTRDYMTIADHHKLQKHLSQTDLVKEL